MIEQWIVCFGRFVLPCKSKHPESKYEPQYTETDTIDYSILTVNLYFEEF